MTFNKVQAAAFDLIQSDARFLYTLTDIRQKARNINSNYIMMCQPYIGIFADGAEQWCKKLKLEAPAFNQREKTYYTALRQGHKLFEKSYSEYETLLLEKFQESDNYFYSIRRIREKLLGYYNVGTDYCNNEFCGNTIICALHTPIMTLGNKTAGVSLRDISVIAGKLAAYFGCTDFPPYRYNDNISVGYKDYHFYKNCPLKLKTDLGEDLYSSLMNQSYSTFKKEKIGNQLSLFTNDIKMVDEYYFYPILSMIVDIIVSVIILIYILRIHVFVGLMMVVIAVATLLVPKMMEKRLKKYSNQLSSYSGIYNSKLKEIFQNFDIILDLDVLKQFVDK